ncbi:MAG: hypothetical protein HFF26_01800 [Oscillospiraceae bacterium]|nr:hypothetical protein [Oscillospiraceae bacterium]
MKERAASFLLANLAVVSLVLPALAAVSVEEPTHAPPPDSLEIQEERSAILLDGQPAWSVEHEMVDDVCYVTVSSFVSLVDAEAMVEEEGGVVSVSASAVTGIVPVEGDLQQSVMEPDLSPMLPDEPDGETPAAGGEDFSLGMTGEGQLEPSYAAAATSDLNMLAAVGASYFVANGRYLYAEDGLIELNGRVAAPVRLLARVFNLSVDYDPVNGQVLLARQPGAEPYLAAGDAVYDSESMMWLARIIFAESGNQPLEGKIAVGNVVMNRVNNPKFPDTVYEVIFQKNQFSPAISGSIYQDPNWDSVVAAMLVLDGAQVVPDALFFNQVGIRCYASRNRDYVTTIGDHAFYN